ncbi:glycoside hydrolase family 15 protein [Phytohalomonas tamaricis]|uniref:glycoside hydrolase family 15 protein n=1 Tax=Phytohalomonas tamaricis TaxID=2081032 RepID=UPI000D0BB380|nr:glycoside hydrolase family 15 protein [Phytohalomonas tamaricis]
MLPSLDLGLIGNCSFAGLIDKRASIVWACMPHLDDDPVFSALLGGNAPEYGRYDIELIDQHGDIEQHYLRNTAILRTVLTDRAGNSVEIIDFAPRFEQFGRTFCPQMLIRYLRPLQGHPRIRIKLRPLFNYGALHPTVTHGSHHIRYVGETQALRLTTNAPVTSILNETPFFLEQDTTLLLGADESITRSIPEVGRSFLEDTKAYWENWVRNLWVPYEWQDVVIRAAITLKLNAFEDTGAVIAAVTTSLPESAHSGRNWDYRYCWLRDACFVVAALNQVGTTQTMEDFIRYIINIASDSQDGYLQPVYRINGSDKLDERIVDSLPGYRGMGPVRIGNEAYLQAQNDVYGSVILAAGHMFLDQRLPRQGDKGLFSRLEVLGEKAVQVFDQPDAGLWEYRGRSEVHTFSSVMCWAACNTLALIANHLGLEQRCAYWQHHADHIHRIIDKRAWNEERQSYVAAFEGDTMDASLLLLSRLGFINAGDPRFASTVQAIEEELRDGDFLYRYIAPDDFGVPEVSFTVCTFWYIDALAALGRRDEARRLYEKLVASRNHLGLLSEDIVTDNGELWGNFPQTYSMVGLINSARLLSRPWEEVF